MSVQSRVKKSADNFLKYLIRDYQIYLILLPSLAVVFIFCYMPMYGVLIGFKDFKLKDGILGSAWVGFEHFGRFLTMGQFYKLVRNTFSISLYSFAVGFPLPIVLALMLNECQYPKFKKTVQMISYAPHFISTVVICGMVLLFTNRSGGMINNIIEAFGGERINFMIEPGWFQTIYVFSGLWQSIGFSSIIYIAALSGIDMQLIEASVLDGANRLQKIWHVDIPSILPTIIILMIFNAGSLLSVGHEKIYLLQNDLNMETSDVISTYVYRVGLVDAQFSYTTAIGLFNSLVNLVMLAVVNRTARALSGTSLW
ncbi:MAG: sugar ABC transporter permease [Clostridia bacterium]|nr:sugar ABC transporter permease [Clostridia bacterium]MBQ4157992.1 sugar ABC transporter permease [Clostridia bacterium]